MPTYTLRPDLTVANAWTVNGGTVASDVLDDAVTQPTAPTATAGSDSVTEGTANDACHVSVGSTVMRAEETVESVTLWVYCATGAKRGIDLQIRVAGAALSGTVRVGHSTAAGWQSVTYTGSLTQTQVDGLEALLTCVSTAGGGGAGTVEAWAAYIELVTTTPDTTAPATPTGLTATAGNGEVALNWDDNTEPDLQDYLVEQSTDGTTWAAAAGSPVTASALTVTGLTNGQSYYFRVAARDTTGNTSAFSASVAATPSAPATTVTVDSVTTTDEDPTVAPHRISNVPGEDAAEIRFTVTTTDASAVTAWRIKKNSISPSTGTLVERGGRLKTPFKPGVGAKPSQFSAASGTQFAPSITHAEIGEAADGDVPLQIWAYSVGTGWNYTPSPLTLPFTIPASIAT